MATGHEWGPEKTREIGGISEEGINVDSARGTLSFGIHIIPELSENWARALAAEAAEDAFLFGLEIPTTGKRVLLSDVPIDEEGIVDAWIKVENMVRRANRRYEEMRAARNQALEILERAGTRVAAMRPAYLDDGPEG